MWEKSGERGRQKPVCFLCIYTLLLVNTLLSTLLSHHSQGASPVRTVFKTRADRRERSERSEGRVVGRERSKKVARADECNALH